MNIPEYDKIKFYLLVKNIFPETVMDEILKRSKSLDYEIVNADRKDKKYKMYCAEESSKDEFYKNFFCNEDIITLLEDRFEVKLSGECEVNYWIYGNSHYLSPHLDKKEKKLTLIIYLNEAWNSNWGGQLRLFTNSTGNESVEIEPLLGTSLFLKRREDSWHEVLPVNNESVQRSSLQVIYK